MDTMQHWEELYEKHSPHFLPEDGSPNCATPWPHDIKNVTGPWAQAINYYGRKRLKIDDDASEVLQKSGLDRMSVATPAFTINPLVLDPEAALMTDLRDQNKEESEPLRQFLTEKCRTLQREGKSWLCALTVQAVPRRQL